MVECFFGRIETSGSELKIVLRTVHLCRGMCIALFDTALCKAKESDEQ